jgi:archaellum biogenesis ATPase FlaH
VRHAPDVFHVPLHRVTWAALREAHKQGLKPDPATLSRISGGQIDVAYLASVLEQRPDLPAPANLKAAVDALLWDHQKHVALTGPVNALLEAMTSGADASRIQGLARAIPASFDGWGTRKHLLDPEELVRAQVGEIRRRMGGTHVYPFGLRGLDFYDPVPGQAASTARRRILPGAAPGRVTMITGSTGSGKSTIAARLVLGLCRQKRRVLYGAWEKSGGMTIELLGCMSLGWSRSDLMEGRLNEEQLAELGERMGAISKWVRFMANPFRRSMGEKLSNARNLDVVHGYIADSGCEIFVADLFERCLVNDEPSEEKAALFRLQAMTEELNIHTIATAQQKKDVATRPDKHPTEEGIKGSGAWGEIADNTFGVYRQYQWKPVPDNTIEIDVLKQRDGKGMLAVEFDWDADRGMISGGRTIEYERPGAASNANSLDAKLREPKKKGDR